MGILGVATLAMPAWSPAAALTGAIFYGLAGINHALHTGRTRLQDVAMITDGLAAVVLILILVAAG